MPIGNAMPIISATGKIAAMLVTAIGPKYARRLPAKMRSRPPVDSAGLPDDGHRQDGRQRDEHFEDRQERSRIQPAAVHERRRQRLPNAMPASTVASITVNA